MHTHTDTDTQTHTRAQDLPTPSLPADATAAFDVAHANIKAFHAAQQQTVPLSVETMPGVNCRRVSRPIGALMCAKAFVQHVCEGVGSVDARVGLWLWITS